MDELKWNWVYIPYLDAPEKQAESALKAGYAKVYFKSDVDKTIAKLLGETYRSNSISVLLAVGMFCGIYGCNL